MLKWIILGIVFFLLPFKWKLLLILLCCFFLWFLKWKPRFDESDIALYFGLPGSGKTTALAYMNQYILRTYHEKIETFTNVPMKGAFEIHRDDLGEYDIHLDQERSVLMIDEASIEYFKRDFAKFTNKENSFHSQHRHYRVQECFFCQTWDGIDLRLREINSSLYYVSSIKIPYVGKVVLIRSISKAFDIKEGQPLDGYKFVGLPRWFRAKPIFKLFNTYEAPVLKHKEWKKWSL